MTKLITLSLISMTLAGSINISLADELMIFPGQGQSNETMEKDKYSCYGWAKEQTGFDPMKAPATTTAPPSQTNQGSTARSAGRGALGGAVLGVIIGDNSKSAARGAVAGGLIGGVRQNYKNNTVDQKTQEWQQREANNYANNRNKYNRAYSACLEGKGYTVR